MRRILLSPDGGEGGGEPAPKRKSVTLSQADYQELMAASERLKTFEAEQERRLREAEAEKLSALKDVEKLREEAERQRQTWEQREAEALKRAQETQSRWHSAEKSRALESALSGFDFVDEKARRHVAALLDTQFEAKATAEGIEVVDKATSRPLADTIKELLPAEYAYALKPTTTGGSGATQNRDTNAAPSAPAGAVVVDRKRFASGDENYIKEMQPRIAEATANGSLFWN